MGTLAQRARRQRGLAATAVALENLMGTILQQIMSRLPTTGTAKAVGPTGGFQRGGALRFGAELREDRGQGESGLTLDAIHGRPVPRGWSKPPVCAVHVTKTG